MSLTRISIKGPTFSAAHSGLHADRFESLHGHTFTTRLTLTGGLDEAGMVLDFRRVQSELARVVEPLRSRTLMPGRAPADVVTYRHADGEVEFSDGHRRFVLPAEDVVVLPLSNTSTELIAWHLLEHLRPILAGVEYAELVLAESPTAQATAIIERPAHG